MFFFLFAKAIWKLTLNVLIYYLKLLLIIIYNNNFCYSAAPNKEKKTLYNSIYM